MDDESIDFYFPYFVRYVNSHFPDESSVVINDLFWMIQSKSFLDHCISEQKEAIVEFLRHLQGRSFSHKIDDAIDCILVHNESCE